MKPNYTAYKSSWAAVKAWHILLFFLVVPVIVMIFNIITVRKYRLDFYDDKIIEHKGWLNTKNKTITFNGVVATSVEKSFWGSMFGYGTVQVDAVGKWDVSTTYIKNPEKLEEYLQTRIVKVQATPVAHMGI